MELLYFSSVPVEIRIAVILSVLLSLSAFFLGSAAVFLFYKFYRDTIKPIPNLVFESKGNLVSLKLINNGHSAFYIERILLMKDRRMSDNLLSFLPMLGNDTSYASFSTNLEGRKVMPDQSVKLFEIDLAFASSGIGHAELQAMLSELNDLIVEIHCHDIGKRYTSVARESLTIPANL